MATTNGAKERFGELLKDCGLSQRGLAQLIPNNLPPDQSRISRAINGQIRLSQDERQRLAGTLHREGCLCRIEDLLWIGEILGMDENELARAAPPPAATTNLTLPDNRPYLAPTGLCTLRDQLTRVRSAGDLYQTWRVQEDLHRIQISAVSGPPGSGKTALLEHLAADYTVRHTFPIILYANLAGETSALPALHAWLAAFGEPPAGLGAAKSMIRHKIGRKRSLFLIDDLADARLLPGLLVGGERSRVVIVCSQGVATEAGIPREAMLAHGGWSGADACRYLESLWSRKLASRERDWALGINELVEGLPLAWVLLAPLLDDHGGWEDVLVGLRVAPIGILNWSHKRLWNSFELAYQRLPRPAQALFRVLGALAPGAPFDAESAAAIRGVSLAEAKRGLAALNQGLFLGTVPTASSGVYRQMHRLLHHFALELIDEDPRREEYAERHARFYAGRARALRKEQNSPAWGKAVGRFLVDLPNVRQGQAWAAERCHRLTVDYFLNVAPYQVATRDRQGHLAWGRAALPVVEANGEDLSSLERLAFYGQLPDPEPACRRAYLERALAIAREEMEEDAIVYQVYAHRWLARFLYDEAGQAMEAEPVLVEALQFAAESGYTALEIHVLCDAARFFLCIRDRAGLEALAGRLPVDPPGMHANGASGGYYHNMRAEVLHEVGRWAEAAETYDRVITLCDETGDRMHGAEVRMRRALCRAHLGDGDGVERDMGWVRERLDELPPRSQMRYQLALGQLALCREEAQSARDVLDDMPEGWDEDLDLALDVWLARYHVEQALGRTAAARAAGEKAKVVAESRGFVLCLYEGQGTERACASAAPVLLEQVVGGRPPLF